MPDTTTPCDIRRRDAFPLRGKFVATDRYIHNAIRCYDSDHLTREEYRFTFERQRFDAITSYGHVWYVMLEHHVAWEDLPIRLGVVETLFNIGEFYGEARVVQLWNDTH